MELDLQSFIRAPFAKLYSLADTPQAAARNPHLPAFGLILYTRALLVSQDRLHLFVTPRCYCFNEEY
jgi:hypothetical protein